MWILQIHWSQGLLSYLEWMETFTVLSLGTKIFILTIIG
jgi:hypothetical protein